MGASEDGSKVFFSSEQKLLMDERETGSNLYEFDFDVPAGQRMLPVDVSAVGAEVQGVVGIAEDGSRVYFVAKGVLAGT